ncbi:MAG: hypothetical protein ABIP94_04530 [Planctomycetota bacterium]
MFASGPPLPRVLRDFLDARGSRGPNAAHSPYPSYHCVGGISFLVFITSSFFCAFGAMTMSSTTFKSPTPGHPSSFSTCSLLGAGLLVLLITGCHSRNRNSGSPPVTGSDGPVDQGTPLIHRTGDAVRGELVFRFETFGNERFWTDAIRLPQGILATNFTPVKALQAGLNVDVEALPLATQQAIAIEVLTDLLPANAPLLNDVATTVALINANAVIGIVAKDTSGDGVIDVTAGDKAGATCALCHTTTDNSVFQLQNGGSIGRRVDGRAAHSLNFGALVALGTNSRAYYPVLQLALTANGGATLGRAPIGLTETSTEAEVDAYLSNPDYYPVGMFDDTLDGNGDPMHNSALFRTDLAAPWGTEGAIATLDNFSNLVYTGLLDTTGITTPSGRAFLRKLGGTAAGDEIVNDYVQVLADTGVTGYPFVVFETTGVAGSETHPLGVRVDDTKLIDMNAYLNGLQAPAGVAPDTAAVARGRELFRNSCTSCHNVDQSRRVPANVLPMRVIFPGDSPVVLLAQRDPPLNPIVNTINNVFDDKMAVVNASIRGDIRGLVMPLLLDLARKPNFLHDNSVPTLDALLAATRGDSAPHPFYVIDVRQRSDMVDFLRSLGTAGN